MEGVLLEVHFFFFFFHRPAPLNSVVLQPVAVTNPFGTLPAMPQISINQGGNSPSIQYGISSMPVSLLFLLQLLYGAFFLLSRSRPNSLCLAVPSKKTPCYTFSSSTCILKLVTIPWFLIIFFFLSGC